MDKQVWFIYLAAEQSEIRPDGTTAPKKIDCVPDLNRLEYYHPSQGPYGTHRHLPSPTR